MRVHRSAVRAWSAVAVVALGAVPVAVACSSSDGPAQPGPSSGGQSSTAGTTSGGSSSAGSNAVGGGGAATQGGSVSAGGAGSGTGGFAGGVGGGGTSAGGATGGTGGGADAGDTPPWRPLNVTAALGEHVHGKAGIDTRAKSLGKLAVDIGVNEGGYSSWLAKRGYHSIGAPCGACPAPNLDNDRDTVGDCRLTEFANTAASVKTTLTNLQTQYPEEDWGYFLNQDGSVRWSDVAITGISHGATTSALAGRIAVRMWRVVSRSGPRDNTCGLGDGKCTLPLSTPAYDPACVDAEVASWLDKPSLTPINRFYALVGMMDGQCGDIMFNMHRTQYIGVPTVFDKVGADLSGTNQFFAVSAGHYDFLAGPSGVTNTDAALEIAFGIPPENQNPKF